MKNSQTINIFLLNFVFLSMLFLTLFPACSSTKFIDISNQDESGKSITIEKFNREFSDRPATLTLTDGTQLNVENVNLRVDSTSFFNIGNYNNNIISTDSISQLTINNSFGGALKGLFFGAVMGAISPAIFEPTFLDVNNTKNKFTVIHGTIIGGTIGFVAGLVAGSNTIYKLHPDPKVLSNESINYMRASTAHNKAKNDARLRLRSGE